MPGQHNGATLLVQVWVNQPRNCEHGRVAPLSHLSWGGMGGGKKPSFYPSMPGADGRVGLGGPKNGSAVPDSHQLEHSGTFSLSFL